MTFDGTEYKYDRKVNSSVVTGKFAEEKKKPIKKKRAIAPPLTSKGIKKWE